MRFAFRHFPLTQIHPHALAAAAAAEAAARQGQVLGHARAAVPPPEGARRQRPGAGTPPSWGSAWRGSIPTGPARAVLERIRRDVASGVASGQVLGTPTLFIDGVVYRGGYDPPTLLAAPDRMSQLVRAAAGHDRTERVIRAYRTATAVAESSGNGHPR